MKQERILFIGGPGNISTSTIHELLDLGYDIAVFKRSKHIESDLIDKITVYYGDRDHKADVASTLEHYQPHSVVDCRCFDQHQAEDILDLIEGKGVHYVLVSTIDVYGYPLSHMPMRESDPRSTLVSDYAIGKSACEDVVWQRVQSGGITATIVRPTYSFGKKGMMSFLTGGGMKHQVARMRAGKPVLVPGDGTTLWHVSCAYNTGRMIAQIIHHRDITVGKSYTCGHDGSISFDDYIRLVANAVGIEPQIVHVPTDLILSVNHQEIEKSYLSNLTRYNMCFSVEAFKKDFPDFEWTKSLDEGALEYVDYHDRHQLIPSVNEPIIEDRIINAYNQTTHDFMSRFSALNG